MTRKKAIKVFILPCFSVCFRGKNIFISLKPYQKTVEPGQPQPPPAEPQAPQVPEPPDMENALLNTKLAPVGRST